MPDLVVVGGGIVGASVAYHAARAGAAVTLVDAVRMGGGVTADSFAWIGSSGVRHGPAADLRINATTEYRRLAAELPQLPVTWSGSLGWSNEENPPEAGPGQQIVDAATMAALEPQLRKPPGWGIWAPDDAAVDAVGVIEQLVAGARAHGADIHWGQPVASVRRDAAGHIAGIETSAGPLVAGTVVLAAGVATAALAASVGVDVPVEPSPCPLIRLSAPAGLVRTLIHNDDFDLRQPGPDYVIAAANSPERTLAAVRSTFRGSDAAELIGTRIGERPMPADGEPIIGPIPDVPGLYVAVMHSGVTLAPVVGRLVAQELVGGAAEPALAGCRPDRF